MKCADPIVLAPQCKLDPTRAEVWASMGSCLVKTEDFIGAQMSFEKALERVNPALIYSN